MLRLISRSFSFLNKARIDRYRGLTLDLTHSEDSTVTIASHLSEERTKLDTYRSITLVFSPQQSSIFPSLIQEGYYFHHATKSEVVLCKWQDGPVDKIPKFPFTQIGIGAVVFNANSELLLVRESSPSSAANKNVWKFITGLCDPGESIAQATLRECKEEANIQVDYLGLLGFRECYPFRWKVNDLCFFNLCRLKSEKVELVDGELSDFKFVSVEEALDLQISPMTRYFANKIKRQTNKCSLEEVEQLMMPGKGFDFDGNKFEMINLYDNRE